MEASDKDWESRAVLNPTVIKTKDGVEHIFYRGVAKNWVSSIGYARLEGSGKGVGGRLVRFDKPLLKPTKGYEAEGVEDPRVTKIGGVYYMLYTAFDGKDARVAYAVSKDLRKWEKKGIISPNISVGEARKLVKIKKYRDRWKHQEIEGSRVCLWDKDAVLFPEKIDGKFVMLHRFLPDVQIVKFRSFKELKSDDFWRRYIINLSEIEDRISLYRRYDWEGEHVGAGAMPIKTRRGWLLIYHGVELLEKKRIRRIVNRIRGKRKPLVYHTGAALLDLKRPEIEITRLENPLFSPRYKWEKEGDINDVVFPGGAVVEGDRLKVYYGCSDSRIGVAEMSFKELLSELGKGK